MVTSGIRVAACDRATLIKFSLPDFAVARMITLRIPGITQVMTAPLGPPRLFYRTFMPVKAAVWCSVMTISAGNNLPIITEGSMLLMLPVRTGLTYTS